MSFRQWLGKKIAGDFYAKKNGKLTDEEREKALMVRRQETALRQAEKQLDFFERLNKLEMRTNPKESTTDLLLKQAIPILLSRIQGEKIGSYGVNPNQQQQALEFTDDQIKGLLDANPKLRTHAKKFSDDDIKEYVMQQIPNISSESIQKIIKEVRA